MDRGHYDGPVSERSRSRRVFPVLLAVLGVLAVGQVWALSSTDAGFLSADPPVGEESDSEVARDASTTPSPTATPASSPSALPSPTASPARRERPDDSPKIAGPLARTGADRLAVTALGLLAVASGSLMVTVAARWGNLRWAADDQSFEATSSVRSTRRFE